MGVRERALRTVGSAFEGPGPSSKRSGVLIGAMARRWDESTDRGECVVAKAWINNWWPAAYAQKGPSGCERAALKRLLK